MKVVNLGVCPQDQHLCVSVNYGLEKTEESLIVKDGSVPCRW